jgi:hypothetical protein
MLNMSDHKDSVQESTTIIPHRTLLPIVDEEDSINAHDNPAETVLEEKEAENSPSGTVYKPVSEASYKGKLDPFANEGGGGMKYKTLAWW